MDTSSEQPRDDEQIAAPDQVEPESQPSAPESGISAPSETDAIELPFRLEDVEDPDQREWLSRRQAQMQAAFTKKTTELAEQRRAIAQLTDLHARLQSEDTRTAALAELAGEFGIDLEFEEPDEPYEPEPQAPVADERVDQLWEAQQSRERADAEQRFTQHVYDALDAYETGLGEDVKLNPRQREQIIASAASLPRREDGLLDMDSAISQYEGWKAAEIEDYLSSKKAPSAPALGGSAGAPAPTKPQGVADRLERALAVAGRHLD